MRRGRRDQNDTIVKVDRTGPTGAEHYPRAGYGLCKERNSEYTVEILKERCFCHRQAFHARQTSASSMHRYTRTRELRLRILRSICWYIITRRGVG